MSEYKQIAIIILAAGASVRMGTPKQLLSYQGRSLLGHITQEAIASVCEPVVVVLGAYAQQIRPELNQLPVQVVENLRWNQGMSASIKSGIQKLNTATNNIEAVVLALCDQPFVSAQIINQLVEAYYHTGKAIVASEYSGTLGVPALFSHRFFFELTDLKETEGAKQVIKKYSHEVYCIDFPEGAIDIDTPNEYEKLKDEGGKGKG